ncbi:hypothetical protein [Comamonas thiooxydans]|nr:hypothetical protein [Comamonas thiooxydans]
MSGMDAGQSIDITPQIWRLFKVMNGMLKKLPSQTATDINPVR